MFNQNTIRSRKEFPDTHYFIYKSKYYPFKINFFKLSSNYFMTQADEICYIKNIDLINEEIGNQLNLQEETIFHFINYVQQKEIPLNNENVIPLHFLSKKYEIEELKEDTAKYISTHHHELALKVLSICQYDSSFNADTFENIICDNMSEYINKDELLNLPICQLHRIFTKYSMKNLNQLKTEEINEFILKMIDCHGSDASVLLSFACFDKENVDFIEKIIQNYSEKVDLHFIDFSFIPSFLEVLNAQKNKLIQEEKEIKELKESNQKMSIEILSLQSKVLSIQKEMFTDFSKQIKDKNDEISSIKAELETVKREKEEEIKSLKSQIDSLSIRFNCTETSKEGPGILSLLKNKQKTPFNKLFVASQSTNDIYTLLVPHADDGFGTNNIGNFYIEFELESAVAMSGVKVFADDSSFPKSFDIAVDGETVISVKEARELNGKYKDMTINFAPI
ncbi:hypothetical protein M9Y10_010102 [Tritrichomonas musculus]|uniref:Uncharacterized protein n=1 Tax=Tritrichomonas musculus TaxID=1915356 RepID=A0ABR2IRE4_9EUKA